MSADITEMILDDHDWFRRQFLRLADLREQPEEAQKVWDALAIQLEIRSALPWMSPTVGFTWASAIRSVTVSLAIRQSMPAPARSYARRPLRPPTITATTVTR